MSKLDLYQNFIHLSRYARWYADKGRRENWEETVDRYITFFADRIKNMDRSVSRSAKNKMLESLEGEVREAILNMDIMPSMRCLMTAGPALKRDNVAGYNCSYAAIDHPRAFDEILYILMCGTGVGFSVERQSIQKLPEVAEEFYDTDTTITVADSKIGWAKAFKELISLLYSGQIPKWDMSAVRPAGTRLRTFGGRASGPEPLDDLFHFASKTFKNAAGRKLTSIECHDLICKIAQIVVVGGVRRSALISLSNLSDDRMRVAKNGNWWVDNQQRALANNSAVYTDKPLFETFMREMWSLHESKSGERGIFSRKASQLQAGRYGRRDIDWMFGTNPCSEIILRPNQFCNLSEVVIRAGDSIKAIERKIRLATILGTIQSTLTQFRYLRKSWQNNTQEERLLGVSLTGICDHEIMSDPHNGTIGILEKGRKIAVEVNQEWSALLGIEESTAITCVKPSGTVSQLVDSASGIHPRFSKYYIRRVRGDKRDPMTQFMIDKGFSVEDDITNSEAVVFSFPQKSPKSAIVADDVSAMDQLQLWETYQEGWCEHKPSATIYYSNDEFFGVCQWIWDRIESISGIALLPRTDHIYKQPPYEAIDEETYHRLLKQLPKVDWSDMNMYEQDDNTVGSQEYACSSGTCEI